MYYKSIYKSPLGNIILASDGTSLSGLWFEGQKYLYDSIKKPSVKTPIEEIIIEENIPFFSKVQIWLDTYFQGEISPIIDFPLAPMGSPFRQSVWKILSEIPYGSVLTYGEIAEKIAQEKNITKMSAQAVGGAVGHNPISIIIPCHRVMGKNGNLTGYAGGIKRKLTLLNLEGVDTRGCVFRNEETQ